MEGYSEKQAITNVDKNVEKLESAFIVGENCKMVQPYWKSFVIPWNLNMELLYDPAIPLLDIYPGEMKTYVHTCVDI